jgi:hypothetical protein
MIRMIYTRADSRVKKQKSGGKTTFVGELARKLNKNLIIVCNSNKSFIRLLMEIAPSVFSKPIKCLKQLNYPLGGHY